MSSEGVILKGLNKAQYLSKVLGFVAFSML